MVSADFWSGKRVFLTGHTGFKGSWISLWLQSMGAVVTGLALDPPSSPSLFEVADVAQGMDSHIGDIRDLELIKSLMAKAKPEIVIHMAAQALVRYSYDNPVETYEVNVMGSVNILEATRQTGGVKAFVNVTSDKCYDNKEWIWGYRENEAMGGYDPYSNSKGCAELVTSSYRNSFFNPNDYATHGLALASGRAGNVIGGGDWALDRLIPDFVNSIMDGKSVVIRSPKAIRPWQHVLEPLSGYLFLAQELYEKGVDYAEGWNFGPVDDDAKPVEWIVERMIQLWGDGASWELDKEPQPHEAHYLKLDTSKARMKLNWHPRWSLFDTLEKITTWYKAYQAGSDMRAFSLEQITEYQNSLKNLKEEKT
ncbi:MAG: CDP-glucose 4,6-dehydratase [SAR324 cluster bacterium]|nr:CDP-glucose 4,6-dehydratase [SAR324 cluster bacterium]